jgi:hypothetical protein
MTEPPIRAAALAKELGERLAAVVPDELEVSVAGPEVRLTERGTKCGMHADLRPWSEMPELPFPTEDGVFSQIVSGGIGHPELERFLEAQAKADEARPPVIEVDEIADSLESVVDQLQDDIAETLAEPWPAVSPGPMPMPFVEVEDGRLRVGFGDPAEPALTLLCVALEDLR